jgi:hypothetical protein
MHGRFHWGVVSGCGGWVEGGTQVVVVVAGCWVHSLDRDQTQLFLSCFCIGCGGHRPGGPGHRLCVCGVVG